MAFGFGSQANKQQAAAQNQLLINQQSSFANALSAGMYGVAGIAASSGFAVPYTVGAYSSEIHQKEAIRKLREQVDSLKTAEPRKVGQRVPDAVQPIRAWRAWSLHGVTMRLSGIGVMATWEPKKRMEAACQNGRPSMLDPAGIMAQHRAPWKDCTCGIWAIKTMDTLMSMVAGNYNIAAIGQVDLWGRVIECENGFRAEYAYPAELWLLDGTPEELGYIYGVPVRTA